MNEGVNRGTMTSSLGDLLLLFPLTSFFIVIVPLIAASVFTSWIALTDRPADGTAAATVKSACQIAERLNAVFMKNVSAMDGGYLLPFGECFATQRTNRGKHLESSIRTSSRNDRRSSSSDRRSSFFDLGAKPNLKNPKFSTA